MDIHMSFLHEISIYRFLAKFLPEEKQKSICQRIDHIIECYATMMRLKGYMSSSLCEDIQAEIDLVMSYVKFDVECSFREQS